MICVPGMRWARGKADESIQNSKFKIKFSHPQGVGFLPTLGNKDSFSTRRTRVRATRGEVLNLHFFHKQNLALAQP